MRELRGRGPYYENGSETLSSKPYISMTALILLPVVAAAGYSLLYLLFGGGIGGAVLIFFIAKLLGK